MESELLLCAPEPVSFQFTLSCAETLIPIMHLQTVAGTRLHPRRPHQGSFLLKGWSICGEQKRVSHTSLTGWRRRVCSGPDSIIWYDDGIIPVLVLTFRQVTGSS